MKKYHYLFLILVIFTCLFITIFPILSGVFFFTFDQARDLIWVKNQIDFRSISLIGPWGSLTGVFFGPLWFWLLAIPYVLSRGSPMVIALFNSLVVFGTMIFIAIVLHKYSKRLAYFMCLLAFLSPGVHVMASTAFSQHLLPLFTFILIYSFAQILLNSNPKYFLLALFSMALMFHAEPPISAFSLPALFLISYISSKRSNFLKLKFLFFSILIFVVPFIPQIIFDLRHGFLQTKAIFSYIHGENTSLGDILPFWQRLVDRPEKIFLAFRMSILKEPAFVSFAILVCTAYVNVKVKTGKFVKKLLEGSLFYVGSLFIIFVIFPPELKLFYMDGIQVVFIFWVAVMIEALWKKGKNYQIILGIFFIFSFWQNMQPVSFLASMKNNFADRLNDTSIFRNQIAVIDWIYKDADKKGFKAYVYQPAVYDFPYQYLFMWYGVERYGYLPEDFAYLPDKPEYVQKKFMQLDRLRDRIKTSGDNLYLIIEKDIYRSRVDNWYVNFPKEKYPLLSVQKFPDQTIIEKRKIL